MAAINPQINPEAPPSYLHLAKSITQPQPDRSMEVALKGIGQVGTAALEAVDTYQKWDIEDTTRKEAGDIRSQYTSELEGTVGKGASVLDGGGDKTAESEDLPEDVQALETKLKTLKSARANGKMTETLYYSALDKSASQLRNRYPGQADYIDRQFEKVTGVNPANAKLRSLIADANAAATSGKSQQNRMFHMVEEMAGDPLAGPLAAKISAGTATYPEVFEVFSKFKQNDLNAHRNSVIRGEAKARDEDTDTLATDHLRQQTSGIQDKYFTAMPVMSGQSKLSAKEIVDKVNTGGEAMSPVELDQHVGALATLRNQAFQEAWAGAHRSIDGAPSIAMGMKGGDDAIKKQIDASLTNFDYAIDRIRSKDFGQAHAAERAVTGITKGAELGLFTNKDEKLRNWALKMKSINGLGDPIAKGLVDTAAMKEGFDDVVSTWLSDKTADAILQGKDSPEVSMKNAIDEAAKNKATSDPKVYNSIVRKAEAIGQPGLEDKNKIGLVYWAFKPENHGVLDNVLPGSKTQFFTRMTAPEITKEVERLSHLDPRVGEMYQVWTRTEYRRLFGQDVNEVNRVLMKEDARLGWNDKEHTIAVDFGPGFGKGGANAPDWLQIKDPIEIRRRREAAQGTIDRVNAGLKAYKNVGEAFGQDTDAFLIHEMTALGLNPDEAKDNPAAQAFGSLLKSKVKSKATR